MNIKWKSKRGSLPGLEQLSTERASEDYYATFYGGTSSAIRRFAA